MKNKNGFTLIELLAVIVVLAVIALIATPIVLNMVNTAKKGSAEASATTYIKAVEVEVLQKYMTEEKINDGDYYVGDLSDVKVKGTSPTNGIVSIKKGNVESAKLCIDNYSIDYDGTNYEISNNNYCKGEVILNINGNELKKTLAKQVEFDITGEDISNITNIVCNNGSEVTLEENSVIVSKVLGETVCKANTSLSNTIDELDNTENYILMIKSDIVEKGLLIQDDKKVTLNLNGKSITHSDINNEGTEYTSGYYIMITAGLLNVIDETNEGGMYTNKMGHAIGTDAAGILNIYGGIYEGRQAVSNWGKGDNIVNIYGGKFYSKFYEAIKNTLGITNIYDGYFGNIEDGKYAVTAYSGTVNIYGGTYSGNEYAIRTGTDSSTTVINIIQTEKPIYITSISQVWKPAIFNKNGTINIKANIANECTNDSTKTTSGLCVYAGEIENGAVQSHSNQNINIDGGTYYGYGQSVNNSSTGVINVKNAELISESRGVWNNHIGTVNLCNVKINSGNYDLRAYGNGLINYSANVIFTSGTNTPKILDSESEKIIPNYTGTCS